MVSDSQAEIFLTKNWAKPFSILDRGNALTSSYLLILRDSYLKLNLQWWDSTLLGFVNL